MRDTCFDLEGASPVAISFGRGRYDVSAPYSPAGPVPEYPFPRESRFHASNTARQEEPYQQVRETLRICGLDAARFGTPAWNPLGEVVQPGDCVLIKPNLVRDFRESQADTADCVTTHGSILRAVVDYVFIALAGRGRIIIADAPHNDCDFAAMRRLTGLDEIQRFYRRHAGFEVEVYDLRPERADKIEGVIVGHSPLPGDPLGYVAVDLGRDSAFYEINHLCHLLYGSEYDMGELHRHQRGEVHEYLISRTILSADVVISLPKLKTHKKVGLTVNMKSLVGINGNKNWLPHHREGTPSQGGDQFADNRLKRRIERSTVARFKRLFPLLGPIRPWVAGPVKSVGRRLFGDTNVDTVRSGNWHGNDTTWRMCIDLNRILMYADAEGRLHDRPVRRFFSLVDGVVAGEGNGPLDPTPRPAGVLVAGFNPVAVDLACARLMGFDPLKITMLRRALNDHGRPLARFALEDVTSICADAAYSGPLSCWQGPGLAFRPHFGWSGHIEFQPEPVGAAFSPAGRN